MKSDLDANLDTSEGTPVEPKYRVVFSGKIRDGLDLGTVRAMVVERLRSASPVQVNRIFSGKRIILKGGLSEAAALKYMGKLERLGMVMSMLPEPVRALEVPHSQPETTKAARVAESTLANSQSMTVVNFGREGAPAESANASDEDSWMTISSFADLARTQVNLDRAEALLNGSGVTDTELNAGESEPVVWPVLAQPEAIATMGVESELVLLEATPVTIVGGHGTDHAHAFVFRGEFVCSHCGVAHPVNANVHVQAVSQSVPH